MPIHGGYVHIDDIADVHLRVLELDPAANSASGTPGSFGACTTLEAFNTFDIVEKAFPKAVANGTFSRGALPKLPISYDSSETERVLGMKFRSFESAVADTAAQYLESRGLEVA
jgi:nucleoside-diphosphate-sugar epimerase